MPLHSRNIVKIKEHMLNEIINALCYYNKYKVKTKCNENTKVELVVKSIIKVTLLTVK